MRIRKDAVWLDDPAKEIHIYFAKLPTMLEAGITKVNVDSLNRVHITVTVTKVPA